MNAKVSEVEPMDSYDAGESGKIREICTTHIAVSVVRIVSVVCDSEISNTVSSIYNMKNKNMKNWHEK